MTVVDILIIISCLVSFILTFIALKNNRIVKRVIDSILIQAFELLLIGPIITIFSIYIESIIQVLISNASKWIKGEYMYLIGYLICIYISPFYAYYINKKKENNQKIYKNILIITICFIILLTIIFLYISFENNI